MTDKCIYCEENREATHFLCENCENGMCDECYHNDTEHLEHIFEWTDIDDLNEIVSFSIQNKIKSNGGFMCYKCYDTLTNEAENKVVDCEEFKGLLYDIGHDGEDIIQFDEHYQNKATIVENYTNFLEFIEVEQ